MLVGECICTKSPSWQEQSQIGAQAREKQTGVDLTPNLEYSAVSGVLWVKRQINMSILMKHYYGSVYGLNTVSPKCVKDHGVSCQHARITENSSWFIPRLKQ